MEKRWRMKSALMKPVAAFMLPGSGVAADAGRLGHYMPGAASIRGFVVPAPGFYYARHNPFYATDTYKDRNGNSVGSVNTGPVTLKVEANIDSFGIVPTQQHMGGGM